MVEKLVDNLVNHNGLLVSTWDIPNITEKGVSTRLRRALSSEWNIPSDVLVLYLPAGDRHIPVDWFTQTRNERVEEKML